MERPGAQAVHPAVRALAWVWTRLPNARLRSVLMWWLNTKFAVGVTGIVYNDAHEVLFVEHAFRRRHPWALPGGWIGRRESLEEALVRELREETGLEVEVVRLVAARTGRRPKLDVAFVCRARRGDVRPSAETPRWRWCPPGAPPPDADPDSLYLLRLSEARTAGGWGPRPEGGDSGGAGLPGR